MIYTLSVVILVFVFVIIDVVPKYKKKEWVSFFLCVSLLVISITIAVLMDLNVEIPSPSEPIKKVVKLIFGLD